MPSYLSLILFVMILYIGIGVGTVFTTYFTTYFFELSEKDLAALGIAAALGGLFSLFVGSKLGKILDKKIAAFYSMIDLIVKS